MESKTIQDYSVYCTPEQTNRALKLGAPLETCDWRITNTNKYIELDNEKGWHIQIPTAEQIAGWLLEYVNDIIVCRGLASTWFYSVYLKNTTDCRSRFNYPTRKAATLAAIDTALDYLEQQKEKEETK